MEDGSRWPGPLSELLRDSIRDEDVEALRVTVAARRRRGGPKRRAPFVLAAAAAASLVVIVGAAIFLATGASTGDSALRSIGEVSLDELAVERRAPSPHRCGRERPSTSRRGR